jgi:hypothetical protein
MITRRSTDQADLKTKGPTDFIGKIASDVQRGLAFGGLIRQAVGIVFAGIFC